MYINPLFISPYYVEVLKMLKATSKLHYKLPSNKQKLCPISKAKSVNLIQFNGHEIAQSYAY